MIFDRSSSRGCPFDVRGIDEHDTTEMAGGIAVETPPALPPSGPCALTTSINISLIPGELDSASPISRDRPDSSRSAIDIRRFNLFRGSSTGRAQGYHERGPESTDPRYFAGDAARTGAFSIASMSGPDPVWQAGGVATTTGVFGRRSGLSDPIVGCRYWPLRLLPLTTTLVGVEILASARRHGISDDDIRHAVENSLAGGRSDDQIDFVMLVGPDQSGNLIEVGIVVTDDIEYAIHAMRARNQYLEWL